MDLGNCAACGNIEFLENKAPVAQKCTYTIKDGVCRGF